MGLLTILKKIKKKERQMRLLLLGLDNAGKTTVCKTFRGEPIESISPTLGFHIESFDYEGYVLDIWDVGGQHTIRSYWRNYFEKTDGIIWVVDAADTRRMLDCKKELEGVMQEERLAGASLLIFANKQDLKGALNAEQIAQILDLDAIQTRHWHIQVCSAVTGQGLAEGMKWLVQDIASRIFFLE